MTAPYNEETVEKLSLEWLADLGYEGAFGPDGRLDRPRFSGNCGGRLRPGNDVLVAGQ